MISNPLRMFQVNGNAQTIAPNHGPAYTHPAGKTRQRTVARTPTLRVLMVTPFYFPSMGGVENHVYQVARRLAHANIDVTVLTTDRSGQLPAQEKIADVQIIRVPAAPANRDYYFAPGVQRIIRQGDWDVVHVQCYHTLVAPLAMAAAWAAKIPYVVTFHGGGNTSQLRNRLRGLQQQLLRPLLARAERLIAVANFEIDHYGERLHLSTERFALIPNGCDLPTLPAGSATTAANDLIISVGRLEQYKGHHRIIAALPYILAQYPTMRLRILGEGPYKATLEAQVAALGLTNHVEIAGIPATQRAKMAEVLGQATLVTLLSDYETHPIAALEALSLKRPVLATDTSGLRELADQGLARTVPLDSTPQAIAAAVVEQLRNPLVPAGLDLPTWDDCARELLLLYRSVTGRF